MGVEAEVAPAAGQGEHAGSPLRFVPLDAGRSAGRSWSFELQAPTPDAEVTLTWPDLSGIGAKDRVSLEDLDAGVKRSMRTCASYVFRGTRRFRVTAEPRTGPALLTGLEVTGDGGRVTGGRCVVRFTLSGSALVDLEVLAPTGRVVGVVTRGRASEAGLNQVAWGGTVPPGVYLLRATASDEEGGRVQVVRPVVVGR